MLFAEDIAAFAIWIAAGVTIWRSLSKRKAALSEMPRNRRAVIAAILLFTSAIAILASLWAIDAGKHMASTGFTIVGWLLLALGGTAFVGMQTYAVILLLSIVTQDVTNDLPPASFNVGRGNEKS